MGLHDILALTCVAQHCCAATGLCAWTKYVFRPVLGYSNSISSEAVDSLPNGLGNVSAMGGGAAICRRRSEAHLIVDDHMNGASSCEACNMHFTCQHKLQQPVSQTCISCMAWSSARDQ